MKNLASTLALIPFTLSACGGSAEPVTYNIPTSQAFKNDVGACYSIFPISFADGNGDGIGDLIGIKDKLGYLKNDLGVDCIWINPVTPSDSYHKYDVDDYMAIDEDFGTMQDFENMTAEAKEIGIKVLFDLVPNHTSRNHEWFKKALAGDAKYKGYYSMRNRADKDKYTGNDGWCGLDVLTEVFCSFDVSMPEVNMSNPEVVKYFNDVATFWLEKGVDGFRIDAAKHVFDPREYPEGTLTWDKTVAYFSQFSDHVKKVNPDAFVVTEVWGSIAETNSYYQMVDSSFNFDAAGDMISSARGIDRVLEGMVSDHRAMASKRPDFIDSLFLSNHDKPRIMNNLGGNIGYAKTAAKIMLTLPGLPFIYYGEELGLTSGGQGVDHKSFRQPFRWEENSSYNVNGTAAGIYNWTAADDAVDWVETQKTDSNSLFSTYKEFLAVRRKLPIMRTGTMRPVVQKGKVMAFVTADETDAILVIHNLHDIDTLTYNISHDVGTAEYNSGTLSGRTITLAPGQSAVFKIDQSISDSIEMTLSNK